MTFFGIFGVITGGLVIQIIAPILLVAAGLSLRWLGLGNLFKGTPQSESPVNKKSRVDSMVVDLKAMDEFLIEPPSGRELEVLHLIEDGLTNQEIADALSVAPSTIKTHINNLYAKLGVKTRVQAIKRAHDLGLL
ncbi:HTH-type transcriptional regulator MalT [bioreactor metagenome]|uniref:HTH-type transcriptional regulator MalT n=1 Tax=bioreactor metagenome TaxID=1076179 RepID=A0A645BA68_9ZZZZ